MRNKLHPADRYALAKIPQATSFSAFFRASPTVSRTVHKPTLGEARAAARELERELGRWGRRACVYAILPTRESIPVPESYEEMTMSEQTTIQADDTAIVTPPADAPSPAQEQPAVGPGPSSKKKAAKPATPSAPKPTKTAKAAAPEPAPQVTKVSVNSVLTEAFAKNIKLPIADALALCKAAGVPTTAGTAGARAL